MFYSQFILAKKGPLGTIWIAAHLERKLRKNQVADTDIGDSVDSILSPDVPIALRLSSHLLLGVVRIYNRKVNYLFDDCSEALLKVKQAFRSTAVDLPPEESKAPYHSITLPEKFDLDDFELPDSDIFEGNYVDHHISSRDQITLQDTMEGVSYSTSKFGLDERFGDADTSGLDLDEELFLGKIDTEGYADERADPQASFGTTLPLKQDQQPEDRAADSEVMVDDEFDDVMDYAHAPCTPGLVEEPNLSNIQDASACDDHLESEYHVMESTIRENPNNAPYEGKQEVDWRSRDDKVSHAQGPSEENECLLGVLEVRESMPQGQIESIKHSEFTNEVMAAPDNLLQKDAVTEAVSEYHTHVLSVDETCCNNQGPNEIGWEKSYSGISGLASIDQQVSQDISAKDLALLEDGVPGNMGDSNQPKSFHNGSEFASENQVGLVETPETQVFEGATGSSALNLDAHDKEAVSETPFLRPCNSVQENAGLTKFGISCLFNDDLNSDGTALPAERGEEIANPEHNLTKNQVQGLPSGEDIEAATSEAGGLVHSAYPHDSLFANVNNPAQSALPPPEKVLSVAEGQIDLNKGMIMEASPVGVGGLDEGDAGSKTAAGRKRSFTESTLTEQSLYSVESSRQVRAKQTAGSVPNDDDLLSSILVGRSSILKVKPTPPHYEVTSMKRTRSAPRPRAPKRKVLMDDTMVLHGDSIRQQLTYTEDIRRVRKKAPCTLPEISMIHQKHLEDGIFLQPIFTGMSVDLASLHSQVYDLSRINVFQNEVNDPFVDILTEPRLPSQKDEHNVSPEIMIQPKLSSHWEMVGASLETRPELQLTPANHRNQDVEDDNGLGEMNVREVSQQGLNNEFFTVRDYEAAEPSVNPLPSENKPVEVDDMNIASPPVIPEVQPLGSTGHGTGDMGDALDGIVQTTSLYETGETSAYVNTDAAIISNQKEAALSVELDYADLYYGEAIVRSEVRERDGYAREEGETELGEKGSILPDATQDTAPTELGFPVQSEICSTTSKEQQDLQYGEAIIRNEVRENDGYAKEKGETDLGEKDGILPGRTQVVPPIALGYPAQSEICSATSQEQQVEFSCRELETMMLNDGFINNSENPDHPESNEPNMTNAGVPGFDLHDRDEVDYWAAANDTDFLNVDDDDLTEMADDHMPDDEEAQFAENSGWSSRTRAVSKYLQAAFIKEADCGRKSISLDNLLIGKSRKEASRMFFETLVLKTRDYIHVEQRNPFDDLAIKPRTRLMKSQF